MLFIADKPNFYKTNLFNKINKLIDLQVVYVGEEKVRRGDYFYSDNMEFKYFILSGSKLKKILEILRITYKYRYTKIVVGGWDNIYYILILLLYKTSVIVESTSDDKNRTSLTSKIKYLIKKILLRKVDVFFCAGFKHKKYVNTICNNKKIIVTKTVGLPFESRKIDKIPILDRKDYVFIGRNSPEKNIDFMIDVFHKSDLSKHNKLILVGDKFEKYQDYDFVKIYEYVSRNSMADFLKNFKALFLFSTSEPYGLVVEEALRCNVPAIVSNRCGIVDTLLYDRYNGIVLDIEDKKESINKVNNFLNIEEKLVENISKMNFDKIDEEAVRSFIE